MSFSRELQFGFLRRRRAGRVPSGEWGCEVLGLGFWALSFHCELLPSGSCFKRICPHGIGFLSVFLDVRLDKRKGRFSHFNACRVISYLLHGGICFLGFFSPLEFLGLQGSFLACVPCSGRLDPGILSLI